MSRLHDAASADPRSIGVSVILSAALRHRLAGTGDGPQRHVLAAGATLADLLAAVGIDASTDLTAAIDGELAGRDTLLRDGAEVVLLAPMEGGAEAEARRRSETGSEVDEGSRGRR
jgi:molybdopterin converting factor small subunit